MSPVRTKSSMVTAVQNLFQLSRRLLKKSILAALQHCGYTISRSAHFSAALPDDALFRRLAPESAKHEYTIALIGTPAEGLNGFGKVSQSLYFPKFGHTLAKLGISLIAYRNPDEAYRNINRHDPAHTAFILVYNEDFQS